MKFNIGDHLQEIGSHHHGIVVKYDEQNLKKALEYGLKVIENE